MSERRASNFFPFYKMDVHGTTVAVQIDEDLGELWMGFEQLDGNVF